MRNVPAGYSREVLLGTGRSGRVWRARQDDIGRMVALKEVPCHDAAEREALRREAAAIGLRELPCLPRLHAVEFGSGRGWIVQEYVHGVSVESLRKSGMEPEEARAIARLVVEAVASLHLSGRSHGDLDPGHLLVDASGRLRLIDLGFSAARTESVRGGSSGYLAPEAGRADADPLSSEIWGLGVLLHEILCGTRPGPRGPDREALARHGSWQGLVEGCLAGDPSHRPGATKLLEALGAPGSTAQALFERVGVQADVELARKLKEAGREALSRRDPRCAWEYLEEAAKIDPDDAETLDLLAKVRFGTPGRSLVPWGVALAIALGCLAGGWWFLSRSEAPPPRVLLRSESRDDRLRMPSRPQSSLPLREGWSP